MLVEFCLLLAVAVALFYRWAVANNDFFEKRGLPYDKPFPLLGSMKDVFLKKRSMFDKVIDFYNQHDGKVYGVFDQRAPLFLLRDPEIFKQITVKEFDHFLNHRSLFGDTSADSSNFFAASLFQLRDDKWKDMRSTLSPAFTGSKMRLMFELMNQVGQGAVTYLKKAELGEKKSFDLDVKDFSTRFSNDIIASTAFGIRVNSLTDKNNRFYRTGKTLTTFGTAQNLKFMFFNTFKPIMKFFKVALFDRACTDYFEHLVLDAVKQRLQKNITRPDMIHMLMEARGLIKSPDNPKTPNREWTDHDMVAQCFIFFFAGFETTALLMCFAAHELMENPETQEKLLHEIEEVCERLEGKPLTYEALHGMKYLDMVVSEVLRKWPPAIALDRECNKDFVYEGDGERIEIKKGEYIWIPVAGIHRDPKIYENPDKFDPERFSDENKSRIHPFTYLPFGVGPRNCIGSRFAILEAKVILFYMVRDFYLEASTKSTVPLVLSSNGFQLTPKDGFWLKFVPRDRK